MGHFQKGPPVALGGVPRQVRGDINLPSGGRRFGRKEEKKKGRNEKRG